MLLVSACVGPGRIAGEGEGADGSASESSSESSGAEPSETETSTSDDDHGDGGGFPQVWCEFGEAPEPRDLLIDVLIVVDNSESMAEEQQKLATAAMQLFESLAQLEVIDGLPAKPSINVMVTSTDMGHPACTPLQPVGYAPKLGAPQAVPCSERLADFTSLDADPIVAPQACESVCPIAHAPVDPFVHVEWSAWGPATNVAGNAAAHALACLIPQGINGCGYESPLESMLQALDPAADWNQGNKPFLREGAALAIMILSDEADCSVRAPEGYAWFTELDTYWEINPDTGTKTNASSAVCWNAGVDCGTPDANGVYADCTAVDNEVLHPTSRYVEYLVNTLRREQGKPVVMVTLSGVPTVTAHNPTPPHEPTAGGVSELVYRESTDAQHEHAYGIGPGCTSEDGMGAIPPVRIQEVCQALDGEGRTRCCMESICDGDYAPAIQCLTGMLQDVIWTG